MLKVKRRIKTENQIVDILHDSATGRSFDLVFFAQGAASTEDGITIMVRGLADCWHVSEYRPNGRIAAKKGLKILDVPSRDWEKISAVPSEVYALMASFKAAHPGYDIIRSPGGFGVRSIYYPNREKAVQAVENALLADVWLMDSEPIRRRKLGRKAQISLEDYAVLSKAPGQERIMQALGRIEKVTVKGQEVEVSTHLDKFRIEVHQRSLEYPESMRVLLSFALNGRPAGYRFARRGFYAVADSIWGSRVPRYDQEEGVSMGIPASGQVFYQSVRPPLGWRLEDMLGCQKGSSDKIYAHVSRPDGHRYVVWGRREGSNLQVKSMGAFEAAEVVRSKLGRYSPIDVSSVPNFWDRVTKAAAKK